MAVKHFEGHDDLTPLRDGRAGNSISALNFGNLVSDAGGRLHGQDGAFHRHRESAQTANFNTDAQNQQEAPEHAKMYRGSIHQVLPGEATGKAFGAKPTV